MSQIEKIHRCLIEKTRTLALAESCSGGHLAAQFTAIPDASKYLLGSLVTYSNEWKRTLLHVTRDTLQKHGAVSRETADEMWIGLMKVSGADFGIAVTGTAGPSGGTKEKPVGTVFIAVGEKGKKPHIVKCVFSGDRRAVIQATCAKAIEELFLLLDL